MKAYTIEKKETKKILQKFQIEYKVYGPTKPGFDSTFDEIKTIDDLHLEYKSTVLPPKKFFHPPRETLFEFEIENNDFKTKEAKHDEKILLFGIHPCDVNAILKLDKFFSDEFNDSHYRNRRKNSVIVALNCVEPGEHSFCKSMETGPFLDKGYDILLTDIGTKYLIETGTNTGKKLIEGLNFDIATNNDFNEKEKKCKLSEKKIRKSMNTHQLAKLAEKNLDHDVWVTLAERGGVADSFPCLSCGSCSIVCPTCYCYDVYDTLDLSLKKGKRVRELDSCQLLEYGGVALGENFRRERKYRIRHWMLCKFGAAAGGHNSSCVGCGRCIRVCPSKIDLTEVEKTLRRG